MHFKYSFFFTWAKGSLWKLPIRKRVQIFKRTDICFCLYPLDTRTSRGSTVTRWWYWIDGCAVQMFFESMTWLMTPQCCFVVFFNACNIFNHVIIVNLQTHFLWHIMEFPFLLPYCLSIFCILSFPFYLHNSLSAYFIAFYHFFFKLLSSLLVLNIHRQAKQPLESCGSQISLWILSLLEEY